MKTLKRIGADGVIKQKGVDAPNIEIEVEDCEEYTATFCFYIVSGNNLSQVHMVVENLGATRVIPDEGGRDCSTTSRDTSDRRSEGHNVSPDSDRCMTTSGDTSDERCVGHDRSPSLNYLMIIGEDTLEKV